MNVLYQYELLELQGNFVGRFSIFNGQWSVLRKGARRPRAMDYILRGGGGFHKYSLQLVEFLAV